MKERFRYNILIHIDKIRWMLTLVLEIGTNQLNPLWEKKTQKHHYLQLASFKEAYDSAGFYIQERSKCSERIKNYKFRREVENQQTKNPKN